ncbi:PqqD family protein [Terriglobus tenax]|uniref:PqqD family protein n=1 Tax=Terriglobus tenax TaxID=1111115 RepID=UPI0021E01C92|nr:PqqD family protein [Terriglobus tenax]
MATDKASLRTIVNEDGAAVLDTERGVISTFNVTGGYVWQALERGESEESIVANLARETGESSEVVGRDVREFIASLKTQQLLSQ